MTLFGRLERLIRRIDQRRCAPKFAQRLGPRLLRDYGASRFYTVAQIRAASAKCRLPRHQLALGYAAFLPLAEFEKAAGNPAHDDYEALRALFFRLARSGADFSTAAAPADFWGGVSDISGTDGSHHGTE
ncbi:hypothetical protein SAMN02990966_05588 [Rhodospirillales bacterium URHD0017]|nr:hypothetical protein SAMN02990966_05588 [Rhodospirillales bacterium URHD0017]